MILPTNAQLIYGKTKQSPVEMAFTVADVARRQARLLERVKLAPEINVKDYRFVALVDFIKFRVAFSRMTNAQSVQMQLRKFLDRDSHIEPIEFGAGSAAMIFDITIQEPKSFAYVSKIYDALKKKFGERTDPLIAKVEFSIDAYPRVPSDQARTKLFGVMQRTILPKFDFLSEASDRPRSSIGKPTGGRIDKNNRKLLPFGQPDEIGLHFWHRHEDHHAPWVDGTLYIGAKEADVMIRLQDKELDQQNMSAGTCVELTESQKRVRIEVTLQGNALLDNNIFELADLRRFSFAKLQGSFFQFMLPTFPVHTIIDGSSLEAVRRYLDGCRAKGFLKSGMLGLEVMDAQRNISTYQIRKSMKHAVGGRRATKKKPRSGTGCNRDYVAYHEMNRCVATALRHLEQREANAWRR